MDWFNRSLGIDFGLLFQTCDQNIFIGEPWQMFRSAWTKNKLFSRFSTPLTNRCWHDFKCRLAAVRYFIDRCHDNIGKLSYPVGRNFTLRLHVPRNYFSKHFHSSLVSREVEICNILHSNGLFVKVNSDGFRTEVCVQMRSNFIGRNRASLY